jgi:hypothetical protein
MGASHRIDRSPPVVIKRPAQSHRDTSPLLARKNVNGFCDAILSPHPVARSRARAGRVPRVSPTHRRLGGTVYGFDRSPVSVSNRGTRP